MKTKNYEFCIICDEHTGGAGRNEDSLYDNKDEGPCCDNCFENLKPELETAESQGLASSKEKNEN